MSTRPTGIFDTRQYICLLVPLLLSSCASFDVNQSIEQTNEDLKGFTRDDLQLYVTSEQRAAQEKTVDALLVKPLDAEAVVKLALVNSPELQVMLARNWANGAQSAQSGRIPNPVFSFERLTSDNELEIERLLSFGLLDLLTLPARAGIANRRIEEAQQRLSSDVVKHITEVRNSWVESIAAAQMLQYAEQVQESAEASAELARRMEEVGNFNRLSRVRQQVFYADATTQLATAQHTARAAREQLIRTLGLNDRQSQRLQLPDRLPDLPEAPRVPADVVQTLNANRLDVRMAQASLAAAAKAQGLSNITSLTDIELGIRRNTVFDDAEDDSISVRGYELEISLPILDWGGQKRDGMNATTLAAANQLEATLRSAASSLRESYSAYRTTYDVVRHYRDEVLPLRSTISEENVSRYNGMLIGVFELLADAREQISAVVEEIDAERQFWLADAALKASIVGTPTMSAVASAAGTSGDGGEGH